MVDILNIRGYRYMKNHRIGVWGTLLAAALFIAAFMPETGALAAGKVTVDHNKPLEEGVFMEPVEGYSFETTTEATVTEYDKFILNVDPGIYISDEFVDTINFLMDTVEEETGLSFNPTNSPLSAVKIKFGKVKIDVFYSTMTAHGITIQSGGAQGISILAEDAAVGDLSGSYSAIVHELLHTIQMRNYGQLGQIITEGFAESYTGSIEPKLKEKFGDRVTSDERSNEILGISSYGQGYFGLEGEGLSWLTADNVEQYFFLEPAHTGHETGYWIVEYIRSQYGEKKFTKLMKALAKEYKSYAKDKKRISDLLPNKNELNVIKSTLSKDFVKKFYKWMMKQPLTYVDEARDYTQTDKVAVGIDVFSNYENDTILSDIGDFRYTDSIEFDFSRSFAFIQQVLKKGCKGISLRFQGTGVLDFYDQYGTLICSYGSEDAYMTGSARVPYATRLVIHAPGEHYMYIGRLCSESFKEVEFEDVSCTDGRKVTYEDTLVRETAPTKPLNITVKTAEEFEKAIKQSYIVGGKITVAEDITVTSYLSINENTVVNIKKGKKLTIGYDTAFNIYGTLSGKAGSLILDGGWLWLNETGTLKLGDITYTSLVRDEFSDDMGMSCGIRVDQYNKKLYITYGLYNRLYITAPEGTDLTKLIYLNDLREGFRIFLNDKQLSDKEIGKLAF